MKTQVEVHPSMKLAKEREQIIQHTTNNRATTRRRRQRRGLRRIQKLSRRKNRH